MITAVLALVLLLLVSWFGFWAYATRRIATTGKPTPKEVKIEQQTKSDVEKIEHESEQAKAAILRASDDDLLERVRREVADK